MVGLQEKRRNRNSCPRSSLLLLVLAVSLLFSFAPFMHPVNGVGKLYVDPPHIATQPAGNTITYHVLVSAMDGFNGWDIQIVTDPAILNPLSVSITGNVLSTSRLLGEFINCINGGSQTQPDGPGNHGCAVNDGPGIVHSAALYGNDVSVNGITGLLFTIQYQVGTGPYSQVTPANDKLAAGGSTAVAHTTVPADYGVAPGILPIAIFTYTPLNPYGGQQINFNATQSYDPNPGHKIINYTWNFADHLVATTKKQNYNYTFPDIGNYTVTLTVTDDLRLTNSTQQTVEVKTLPFHDIAFADIRVSKEDSILPGQPVDITMIVINHGTFTEKGFNLTLSVENQVLWPPVNYTGGIIPNQRINEGPFRWDTTGKAVGIYQIKAELMPLRASNGTILERNSCPTGVCLSNNIGYHLVRIILPQGTSLVSLSMTQSLGIVVGLLAASGAAWNIIGSRAEKRKRREAEALP